MRVGWIRNVSRDITYLVERFPDDFALILDSETNDADLDEIAKLNPLTRLEIVGPTDHILTRLRDLTRLESLVILRRTPREDWAHHLRDAPAHRAQDFAATRNSHGRLAPV
jgi:hypothetical protein